MLKKDHLYNIKWRDIQYSGAWLSFEDVDERTKDKEPNNNVGFFIKETPSSYCFASGIDKDSEQYFDLSEFPKGCIVSIKEIKIKGRDQKRIKALEKENKQLKDRLKNIKII